MLKLRSDDKKRFSHFSVDFHLKIVSLLVRNFQTSNMFFSDYFGVYGDLNGNFLCLVSIQIVATIRRKRHVDAGDKSFSIKRIRRREFYQIN